MSSNTIACAERVIVELGLAEQLTTVEGRFGVVWPWWTQLVHQVDDNVDRMGVHSGLFADEVTFILSELPVPVRQRNLGVVEAYLRVLPAEHLAMLSEFDGSGWYAAKIEDLRVLA